MGLGKGYCLGKRCCLGLKMGLGKGCCPRKRYCFGPKMGSKGKVVLEKKMGLGRGCGLCCLKVKMGQEEDVA